MSMHSSNRADIHQTTTLLPPAESEPPPTARWTPPPALIESSRFGSAEELAHLADLAASVEAELSRVERVAS
jgi:hypothetical protein